MLKRRPKTGAVLAIICGGVWVAVATADVWDTGDESILNTANELIHGSDQIHELGRAGFSASGRDVDHFRIGERPYSSYEVVVDGLTNEVVAPGVNILTLERYKGTSFIQHSSPTSLADSSRSIRWENGPSNLSNGRIRVASSNPCFGCSSSHNAYHIRAYETTYSIPRFNNTGTQVTTIVLQNTSADPVSGHANFWSAAGALLGQLPFTLAARQTLVQNTSGLPFAAGASGAITVTHDGAYGDLSGKAVALEPATGFTFDTALTPRPR